MQSRTGQRRQIEGWGFSLLLHGIFLIAIVSVFRHFPAPIHPEPFKWNVMFIELPQQTPPVEPASDTSFEKEFLRTSEAGIHSSVPSATKAPWTPEHAKRGSARITEESSSASQLLATASPTPIAPTQPKISQPTSPAIQAMPDAQEALHSEQPDTNMTAPPVSPESSPQPMAPIEQDLPSNPASSAADTAAAPAQPSDTAPASPPPAPTATSDQPSASQTDYGWLQRAVSHRLEELKRSSRPFLDESSKLKVLVKAVVSSTGELMEAEVVKSSGLNRIDQEAMALVQRAFPLPLDHTLDRQQIVMRIPITYSRD